MYTADLPHLSIPSPSKTLKKTLFCKRESMLTMTVSVHFKFYLEFFNMTWF